MVHGGGTCRAGAGSREGENGSTGAKHRAKKGKREAAMTQLLWPCCLSRLVSFIVKGVRI